MEKEILKELRETIKNFLEYLDLNGYEINENGMLVTPIPLFGGDYIVEQIIAPNGYLLNTESIEFSIKENTKLIELDLSNNKLTELVVNNKSELKIIYFDETFVADFMRFLYKKS